MIIEIELRFNWNCLKSEKTTCVWIKLFVCNDNISSRWNCLKNEKTICVWIKLFICDDDISFMSENEIMTKLDKNMIDDVNMRWDIDVILNNDARAFDIIVDKIKVTIFDI